MRVVDLIVKKRNGLVLTGEEITTFINGYTEGSVTDYQMAAFCMAVYFQGMNLEETSHLTMAMANSGDTVDLSEIPGIKVDKHSTGGVADTTTLVLAPLVAAAGVPVAKMSGRGLGHTGGTIDKLESIPGFIAALNREKFIQQVNRLKLAVVSQSGNLVPADKKLYALRDVTGTVDALPLIASSIMSKKIAAGCQAMVLDVKTGSGAFMKNVKDSVKLAETMVSIGNKMGRETIAVVSQMEEPLGNAIGNALEVEEAILTLQGQLQGSLRNLSLLLGAYMLKLGGKSSTLDEGYELLTKLLDSGVALNQFGQMIEAQGGNPDVIKDISLLPQARWKEKITSWKDGYLKINNAQNLGTGAMLLGAGRETKDSIIDLAVGIKIHKKTGAQVVKGQPLVTLYYNNQEKMPEALKIIKESLSITDDFVAPQPLIHEVITSRGRENMEFCLSR